VLFRSASQQVLANAQQQAQAQAAQQAAQDPVVQQQQMELQLRQKELEDKKEIELAKIQKDLVIAGKSDDTKIQIQNMKDHATGFQTGFNAVKDAVAKNAERSHGSSEKDKDREFSAAQERGRNL